MPRNHGEKLPHTFRMAIIQYKRREGEGEGKGRGR
jgi:hypothetical protein